jgi:hypothetical protein
VVFDSPFEAGVMYINIFNSMARRMKRRGNCPTVRSKRALVTERLNERFARDGYTASVVLEGLEPGWRSLDSYIKIFPLEISGREKVVALFRLELASCLLEAS